MPSTVCNSVVMVLDSSTVITPSLPTFFIASAMMSPMVASLLAEIVPTCAIMSPETGFDSFLNFFNGDFDGLLDAALDRHRIRSRGHCLDTLAENRLRQNGRRGGAVTGNIGGFRRNFAHHLRAHVFERILQLDFLGYRHTVFGDGRSAEFLLQNDIAALGAERHLHRIGQLVDAAQNRLAGMVAINNLFCHIDDFPISRN